MFDPSLAVENFVGASASSSSFVSYFVASSNNYDSTHNSIFNSIHISIHCFDHFTFVVDHTSATVNMTNYDRTLKELLAPDIAYQPLCIQYPQ